MTPERIAVIIPVYRVEAYLERCLDCVLAQTYRNIEVILVDDGSPDTCPAICDAYAKKDGRVRVIHKENGGLSDARNAGVAACSSEYAVFVDPDDFVDEDHLASLAELKTRHDADAACTPQIFESESGKQKRLTPFRETVLDAYRAKCMVMRARHGIGVSVCSKLFPVAVLMSHPFPSGKVHEDLKIALSLFGALPRVAIGPHATYHYMQRPSSIMHSTINRESLLTELESLAGLADACGPEETELKRALVYRLFDLVNHYCGVIKPDRALTEAVQRYLIPHREMLFSDPENSMKTKMKGRMLTGSAMMFHLFSRLRGISTNRFLHG